MERGVINPKLPCEKFYDALLNNGINYFCGVPDSLLSPFIFFLEKNAKEKNTISVNEGNAVALAVGYYLASGEVPLVYMQNSGLGNAINPLVSMVDPSVMGIPMILLIGWRGEPGYKDEPQHFKQGAITTSLLDALGVPFERLSCDSERVEAQVRKCHQSAIRLDRPFALLVGKNTFIEEQQLDKANTKYSMSREYALAQILDTLDESDIVVSTTGKVSRELFEYKKKTNRDHKQDLLLVGGMGHASSVACSIAERKPKRKIFLIDGDGALLMHMGALTTIGNKELDNFYHFVLNNGSYESVGGQPTNSFDIDFLKIARASGYTHALSIFNKEELVKKLSSVKNLEGKIFVDIRINNSSREDLTRPNIHPSKNKESFMSFLG